MTTTDIRAQLEESQKIIDATAGFKRLYVSGNELHKRWRKENRALIAVLERAESWELQATCEGTINPVWAEAIKHCAADLRRTIEGAA